MKAIFDLAEKFLEAGGIRKDIILLVIAGNLHSAESG